MNQKRKKNLFRADAAVKGAVVRLLQKRFRKIYKREKDKPILRW